MQCSPRKTRLPSSCCTSSTTCRCPTMGLSTSDVNAILAFLETAAAQPAAPAAEAAGAPAVQGNPEIGKELFTGVVRFANGGPPCMACHSAGGIGALGGGQLGPDLTAVATRYGGAAGLDAFVAGTPTPTMKAVWSQHPLTTEERASVVAFLGQAGVSERPAEAIWQLAGLAALGLVVLLAVAGFRWRNRLRNGVRRPMMAAPTTGPGAFHRTIADERGQHTGPYHGGWFTGTFHAGWMARFRSERQRRASRPRTHRGDADELDTRPRQSAGAQVGRVLPQPLVSTTTSYAARMASTAPAAAPGRST